MLSGPTNIPTIFQKNLKTSTILSKSSIWDAWLGPECSSAGGFNKLFKIQVQRYLAPSKDVIFRSSSQLIV